MGKLHSTSEILKLMENIEQVRNFGLVGHIDHGKTTLADSLLAEAGLLSESLAGEARALDYLEEEQRRGITMKAANVSLYYENQSDKVEENKSFVINLVDTPGHLDFSGKVTRALRLVDGVVVIVDAVEELNSQSETVLRQALEEGVKPLLFINKIDRLFRELKLTNDDIRVKFARIIKRFNNLIERFMDSEFKSKWLVSAENGSVMFGSALHRWGFTLEKLQKMNWNFTNIYDKYQDDEFRDLHTILPVWETVLSMVVRHFPNPKVAQKYRIGKIWTGDMTSTIGKSMLECNPKGPLIICMSNIKYDVHGLIGTGRIFSGTLQRGNNVYLLDIQQKDRALKVALYMGARLDNVDVIPAGNIAAISGLKLIRSGETLIDEKYAENMISFERVKYVSDPVVTVAIEPEMLKDLNSLQESLDQVLIDDPNLQYSVSNDTGEVLLSGMGPLHLEVACKEIEKKGFNITVSKPMSVFRESVAKESESITIKSGDEKSSLTLRVMRTDNKLIQYLQSRKAGPSRTLQQNIQEFIKNGCIETEEAECLWYSDNYGNILVNGAEDLEIEEYKGKKDFILKKKEKSSKRGKKILEKTQFIKESTLYDIVNAIRSILISGPLCRERLTELKIVIEQLSIEKSIDEFNVSDITTLFREAIFRAITKTGSILMEPIYQLVVNTPPSLMGNVTNLLNQYSAKITDVVQDEYNSTISAFIPVREYIPFSEEIRSTTSGRAFWQAQFHSFEEVAANKIDTILSEIKFRKGMFYETSLNK
jgi:elongation factor 2